MKYYVFYFAILLFGVVACTSDSDLERLTDETYSKIDSDTLDVTINALGLDQIVVDKYFVVSAREKEFIKRAKKENIFSYKALALPESDNPNKRDLSDEVQDVIFSCDKKNYFFGYPIATKINGKLLVAAERRESEKFINDFSDNFMLTLDEDNNWQQTDFIKYAPYGDQFAGSAPVIGVTPTGKVFVKGKGMLMSDGDFSSWTHSTSAFNNIPDADMYKEAGPKMTYSSKFGLFFGTGQAKDKAETAPAAIFSVDENTGDVTRVKHDYIGKYEQSDRVKDLRYLVKPVFYSIESDELSEYKGSIVGFGLYRDRVMQLVYRYEEGDTWDDVEFDVYPTNILGSMSRHSPVGIDYNPVTHRFEIIHSSPYLLDLWSISASDMLNAEVDQYTKEVKWTKEAILMDRLVTLRGQGMHPAGTVMDLENNVQHIYFHAGDEYPARSGIFELTRTLNTDELASWVDATRAELATMHFSD
ncbi:hypothetical protein EMN47_03045 [Prolixibacteraceae bacterium JC049]|nr:hypothetical protein [Prolixibacteraceae bacterium JC049]